MIYTLDPICATRFELRAIFFLWSLQVLADSQIKQWQFLHSYVEVSIKQSDLNKTHSPEMNLLRDVEGYTSVDYIKNEKGVKNVHTKEKLLTKKRFLTLTKYKP